MLTQKDFDKLEEMCKMLLRSKTANNAQQVLDLVEKHFVGENTPTLPNPTGPYTGHRGKDHIVKTRPEGFIQQDSDQQKPNTFIRTSKDSAKGDIKR